MKEQLKELIQEYKSDKLSLQQVVDKIDDLYTNDVWLNLKDRQEAFVKELSSYLEVYDKKMLNDFYKYWGVPRSPKARLMPLEKEKSWNLKARLRTWSENNKKFAIVNLLKK